MIKCLVSPHLRCTALNFIHGRVWQAWISSDPQLLQQNVDCWSVKQLINEFHPQHLTQPLFFMDLRLPVQHIPHGLQSWNSCSGPQKAEGVHSRREEEALKC